MENGDYEIFLVELFNCNSKEELNKLEREHIEKNECVNLIIPMRTKKEWKNDNIDNIKEKRKQYTEKNKEKLKTCRKQNYEKNKERVKLQNKKYSEQHKEHISLKAKEYRAKNIELIKEKSKEYINNIKDRLQEKFNCCCGGKYTKANTAIHSRTKKHKDYLSTSVLSS